MRKIPEEIIELGKNLKVEPKEKNGLIVQERKYKLITPLFGGGVSPRENDPTKLIRETSIRGQLRFWWRALRSDGNLKEMLKRESEIFGSADEKFGQSKLKITVSVDKEGTSASLFEINNGKLKVKKEDWGNIAYAAFSLQPTSDELKANRNPPMKPVRGGVEFSLNLIFPESEKTEIEAALWAWETFGGIGGRTRRGFGALCCKEIDGKSQTLPKKSEVECIIRCKLKLYLPQNRNVDKCLPVLSENTIFKVTDKNNSEEAWEYLIGKLRAFRQFRRDKNGDIHNFGKSQWCEPDAVRFIAQRRPNENLVKFPRGEFGLPIIFHFPQEKDLDDFTLNLKDYERLASPLILRPIACSDGAVGLTLLLDAPRATEMNLKVTSRNIEKEVSAQLTEQEAKELTSGLTPLKNKTDVLQAFLDTI